MGRRRRLRTVRRRVVLVCLLVAAALGGRAAPAWAHANLVRTDPANGAVLVRAPAAVRVVFDEDVRVGPGVAAVRNGGGSILRGRARIVGGNSLVVALRHGLADGDYSVRWSIFSDDGHLESGVIAFAVGAGRAPPQAGLEPVATGPTLDSTFSRWLFTAGTLGAVGIALLGLIVVRRPDGETAERIALLLVVSAVFVAGGAGSEAHRVGLDTRDGTALTVGLVVAVVVALLAGAATLERRALRPALVLALGLVAVPSVAGHALDPGLARVNVGADVLHVAGAAAWAGVLVGVVALPLAPTELRRASSLALVGAAVVAMTGIVRASFELLAVSQLWSTGYGRALLVKTAFFVLLVWLGRLNRARLVPLLARARLRRNVTAELVLLAGLVAAVAVLVQLRPGRNTIALAAAPAPAVSVAEPGPQPPRPPRGAVVLAREAGPLAVAVEVEPRRLTAIVLSPAGGGLSGLGVRFLPAGAAAVPCGSGCYSAPLAARGTVTVEVTGLGPMRRATFALPASAPAADKLVRRAQRVFHGLAGVSYRERLASDLTHVVVSRWRIERPNRVFYAIPGGAEGIVVGTRRWDRDTPGGRWRASAQTPLTQPATQWETSTNAHVVARGRGTVTVTFADPGIPAFFSVVFDRRTLLPRVLHMTAAAHFMTDRYTGFDPTRVIRAPG